MLPPVLAARYRPSTERQVGTDRVRSCRQSSRCSGRRNARSSTAAVRPTGSASAVRRPRKSGLRCRAVGPIASIRTTSRCVSRRTQLTRCTRPTLGHAVNIRCRRAGLAGSILIVWSVASSWRCSAEGVATTATPPGRTTRASSSALRGANTLIARSTVASRSGIPCQMLARTPAILGWARTARREAAREMSTATPSAPGSVASTAARWCAVPAPASKITDVPRAPTEPAVSASAVVSGRSWPASCIAARAATMSGSSPIGQRRPLGSSVT